MWGHEERCHDADIGSPGCQRPSGWSFWSERSMPRLTPGKDGPGLIPGLGSSEDWDERWSRETRPERTERMLGGVLVYRGRWVYCVQRGAATARERRLMHLGGRTESVDPRGRTDGSPPGGM